MDELISKQAAIEAINLWLYCDKDERMPADVIKALPPVYVPDTNVGETESSHESDTEITRCSDDTISRQAVLELPRNITRNMRGKVVEESIDVELIEALPPVQTEIIHCKDCLYKKICSWKNQGATFCSFGERGNVE